MNSTPIKSEIIWHYTTTDCFDKIIKSQKLKLSNIFGSNDDLDFHPFELISRHKCFNELREKEKEHFKTVLNNTEFFGKSTIENQYIGIACFTKNGDDLYSWQAYGNKGDGVAIGFDFAELKKCLRVSDPDIFKIEDVSYLPRKESDLIFDIFNEIKSLNDEDFYTPLINRFSFLKDISFEVENEVRLLCRPFLISTSDKETLFVHNLYCDNVYYFDFSNNKGLIKKIIIGNDCIYKEPRERDKLIKTLRDVGFSLKITDFILSRVPLKRSTNERKSL